MKQQHNEEYHNQNLYYVIFSGEQYESLIWQMVGEKSQKKFELFDGMVAILQCVNKEWRKRNKPLKKPIAELSCFTNDLSLEKTKQIQSTIKHRNKYHYLVYSSPENQNPLLIKEAENFAKANQMIFFNVNEVSPHKIMENLLLLAHADYSFKRQIDEHHFNSKFQNWKNLTANKVNQAFEKAKTEFCKTSWKSYLFKSAEQYCDRRKPVMTHSNVLYILFLFFQSEEGGLGLQSLKFQLLLALFPTLQVKTDTIAKQTLLRFTKHLGSHPPVREDLAKDNIKDKAITFLIIITKIFDDFVLPMDISSLIIKCLLFLEKAEPANYRINNPKFGS